MFLWTKNALFGVNKRVQGPIKGNPNGLEYNIEQWWINPAAK
jgi:hypothetical protein